MSVFNDILIALKTNIQNKVGARAAVVKRKRAIVLPGDRLPMIVVCPNGGETLEEEVFTGSGTDTVWEYPVLVTILTKGDRVQDLELTEDLELRQDVRNEIYKAQLVGASTTWDTRIETRQPFAQVDVQGVYDVTGFSLFVKSEETRG